MSRDQVSGFVLLTLCLATLSPAAEFIVHRGNRQFVAADNGFHYYYRITDPFPSTWPANWLSPVDYYDGAWYVRVELKTTPKSLPISYQTCIWMHDADGTSTTADELESCSSIKVEMDVPQVYAIVTNPIRTWWHKNDGANAVDLSRPDDFKRLGLVLRTASGCYVSPYNVEPNCWDQRADYVPMDIHLTIVAVSEGATFSGWSNYVTVDPGRAPASLTSAPQDITVAEGQPATFSVVSVGTAPVTYQWQVAPSGYNANNIPNSNAASYTIASALRATSGYRFRCIVTNAYGTETSAFATLTVTAGSPVTVPEADRGRENRAVRFELAQSSDVHMTLHSLDGRAVHDVLHARFGAGTHAVAVPAVRTASGLFLCRVKTRQGNAVVPCFQPR